MKKLFLLLCLASFAVTGSFAKNLLQVFEKSGTARESVAPLKKGLKELKVDMNKEISTEHLTAIHFILSHTYENYIHKMRGEKENEVYYSDDGREAVYDKDGNLVTNAWNKGSYNYAPFDKPIDKFDKDIWPWLIWGNSREDPTDFAERLFYYIMDLNIGIQDYFWLEDLESLKTVEWKDVSTIEEKLFYHFFEYLLFNESYEISLVPENFVRFREDSEFFWTYIYQIMDLIGFQKD